MKSVMSICGTAVAVIGGIATVTAADPQLTNTTSFDIPFVVESSDGQPVSGSALLFSSVDGGPLEQTQRVDAAAGAFHFTAPSDGHYSFAVRMTDAAGQMAGDDGPLLPELEVVVDTAAPELTIQLAEIAPGKIRVSWISRDSQIAPGSVRLEYAEGTDGRWKPIDTTPSPSGQSTIEIRTATSVSVRGYITDLAGNQGSGTAQIVLTASAASQPEIRPPAVGTDNLNIPTDTGTDSASTAGPLMGPTPFSGQTIPKLPAPMQPQLPIPSGGLPQNDLNMAQNDPAVGTLPSNPGTPYYDGSGTSYPQTFGQPAPQLPGPKSFGNPADPLTYDNSANYGNSANYNNSPNYDNTSDYQNTAGYSNAPTLPQVVNNRVFSISYEVQEVGPSGVGSVELFVTENNGQQWFKYGNDTDRQSPFQVDSRGEGTFGFAVRVRNGLGFSDPPPQPGEPPSIVVTVDQTPPTAKLAQPRVISSDRGRIQLQWQVTDARLDTTPVRLEYAISPSGPWTPVFDWQQDPGGYELPIQPGLPTTLNFRLLARDAAGNIATAQTPRPVLIDQRRPTARLLRVQPASAIRRY